MDVVTRRVTEIIPGIREDRFDWIKIYGKVALTGEALRINNYSEALGRWYTIHSYCPKPGYFIVIFHDISDIKKSEIELSEKNDELTSLYEELSATEEELRQQFEEICTHKEQLQHMAFHDSLTGLPNRLALYNDFPDITDSNTAQCKAMMYVDTDNFKYINDTMGHSVGDELVKQIGYRLADMIGTRYRIYRLGGDEYIIFMSCISCINEVKEFADKLVKSFQVPYTVNGHILHVTSSIGVALYPEHGRSVDEILKYADIALYQAKANGKNSVIFYQTDMNKAVTQRMMVEKHLRNALENNEFLLHFQPQIDILTGCISGFEALLRWNNPKLGNVPPDQFIKIAEDTHLIVPIGDWVLNEACRFMKGIHNKGFGGLTISVNISILQLMQVDFCDNVMNTLESTDLDPDCLEIEITESILMESYDLIQKKLENLRVKGVKIALDDFGQGYSSLSYLRKLPITTLKIDKIFIDSISENGMDKSFTDTIVLIGQKMGLNVIAEGVEKKEQLDYLREHGCHKVQGYYFSRPVPGCRVEELLRSYCK